MESLLFEYSLENRLTMALIALSASVFFIAQLRTLLGMRFLEQRFALHMDAITRKLNRENRPASTRIWRGVIVVFYLTLLSTLSAYAIIWISAQHAYGVLLYGFCLVALLPSNRLLSEGAHLRRLLRTNKEDAAKAWLTARSDYDTQHADAATLMRWLSHQMIRRLVLRVITPLVAFISIGLWGAIIVAVLTAALTHWRARHNKDDLFFWALHHCHNLLHALPARFAIVPLLCAMLFTPKARLIKALRCMVRHKKGGTSGCETVPMATVAGAMHISLGGPERYVSGIQRSLPWLGDGSAQLHRDDFSRLLVLLALCVFMLWLMIATALASLQFFTN